MSQRKPLDPVSFYAYWNGVIDAGIILIVIAGLNLLLGD